MYHIACGGGGGILSLATQAGPTPPAKHSERYWTDSLYFLFREYYINDALIALHTDILLIILVNIFMIEQVKLWI